jgi:RNA polymerase sigma-70 factor (sigma-E family)
MANLDAGLKTGRSVPAAGPEPDVAELFRARYLEMVRLAGLLGADDPEDIAQEAFTRLMNRRPGLRDAEATVAYLRAIVCNLTRNRHRHLRVVRQRTPSAVAEQSCEQAALGWEEHRDVITALAALPSRRREAIVLRYWLDLPEREIAAAMGISQGTVKSHVSRGLAALATALGARDQEGGA